MKLIQLTRGMTAKVSDVDYAVIKTLGPWYAAKCGDKWYAARHARTPGSRRTLYMHAVIRPAASGCVRDHKDGDGLNNQRSNVRIATYAQNAANKTKQRNGKCKYIGVTTHRRRPGMFRAVCKSKDLGFFPTPEAAAMAYDKAARSTFGRFARVNFGGVPSHSQFGF